MLNLFLILPLLLAWLGYKQYCWINHYSKAKKYYFLENPNLSFLFGVRVNYHSMKLIAISVFLVLSVFLFEYQSNIKSMASKLDLIMCVFITAFAVLSVICFMIQARYEKKLNLLIAKAQDFRNHSVVSNSQKNQIISALTYANKSFMLFSVSYLILNFLFIFLV